MRIATWNVNGLRARLEFFVGWLRDRQPDVVALQELKLEEAAFPRAELADLGYEAVVHGQKSWNGGAVFSRSELRTVAPGLAGQEDMGERLVSADLNELRVTSVYCPNGKTLEHPDYARKLTWFDALADHLERSTGDLPTIVGGDFNVCPQAIDSWNEAQLAGQIFHSEPERRRFQRLLDLGFVDVFRKLHPDRQEYSWWDYRGGAFHRKQGLRIDFLLANASAAARVRDAFIDRDYRKKQDGLTPSDHAPVVLDLDD